MRTWLLLPQPQTCLCCQQCLKYYVWCINFCGSLTAALQNLQAQVALKQFRVAAVLQLRRLTKMWGDFDCLKSLKCVEMHIMLNLSVVMRLELFCMFIVGGFSWIFRAFKSLWFNCRDVFWFLSCRKLTYNLKIDQ